MYADFEYYQNEYHGTAIAYADWEALGTRASDFLDFATGRKLVDNLPTDDYGLRAVRHACCAVAEEIQRTDAVKAQQGGAEGVIRSISSGGESYTYEATAAAQAVALGPTGVQAYLYGTVKTYLSLISDDAGNYYLYRGLD